MSRFDESALAGVPTTPRTLTLYYRHVYIPPREPPDPLRTSSQPSRWATGRGTLYATTSEPAAWAEYCRRHAADVERADVTGGIGINRVNFGAYAARAVPAPLPARALFGVEVRFQRLADLTRPGTLSALERTGFDPADLLADDYGACPEVASAGERLGWEAILAPSAAWRHADGSSVAIFHGAKPPRADFRVLHRAARPSVAVAYATTYRQDERPGWLT